ncbi:MAG TPA: PKD domain-containing protein [Candidatus Thermoplasmatota archaeon]|nr:PKD domain-containing protein [Candidatus Thermoplasmatota archaeon]
MIKKRNYLLICMLVLVLVAPTAISLHTDILTPPNPPTINGPHCGKINTNYTFTINASIDPEGDLYYFFLEWGDGNNSGWLGPYPSDQTFTVTHRWSEPGTYNFRLKVKDPFGVESDWSEPFTIYITSKIILIGFVQSAGNQCENCTILNMSIALVIKLKPIGLKLYSSIQVLLLNDEFKGLIGSHFFAVVGYGLVL